MPVEEEGGETDGKEKDKTESGEDDKSFWEGIIS
jgi:hypothetical protein